MLKKTISMCGVIAAASLLFSFSKQPVQKVVKTVVIDAGHGMRGNGGYDGAKGTYSYEDEICYAVSKELVQRMRSKYPEIAIIETRPTKNITALKERANIANHNRGDLFISIHVNAAPDKQHKEFVGNKTVVSYVGKGKKRKKITKQIPQYRYYSTPNPAKGTETYIWGAHKNDDKEVAMRENAPMLAEENYREKYGDLDPNSPEFIALSLLKTKQFFKRSATLAGMVEDEFFKVGRTSRGEKQRSVGIWVLQATAMPSVLIETGYITNKAEEDYLNSRDGQAEIANCVTKAVGSYISWLEKQQVSSGAQTGLQKTPAKEVFTFLSEVDKQERQRKGLTK